VAEGLGIDLDHVPVSDREMKSYAAAPPSGGVAETAVYGESRYDRAVYASDSSMSVPEDVLDLISSDSFPSRGRQDSVTSGQRHPFRDAMIVEAHVRTGRDIFVSDDRKALSDAMGCCARRWKHDTERRPSIRRSSFIMRRAFAERAARLHQPAP